VNAAFIAMATRCDLLAALEARGSRTSRRARSLRVGARLKWNRTAPAREALAKRAVDIGLASAALAVAAPVWVPLAAWLALRGRVFDRTRCLGRNGTAFDLLAFAVHGDGPGRLGRTLGLHRLAALFNVIRGQMSMAGPRPAPIGELSPRDAAARARYQVRPGLVGPWWVRQRTNVAYGHEAAADREYVTTWSVRGDLGLLARAALALAYGGRGEPATTRRVSMLGVSIDNVTMDDALETVGGWLEARGTHQVAFVNADCLNIAWRDRAYRRMLAGTALTLGDGIGLKIGGSILGRPIRQNVNGTDLFPRLCELASRKQARIFLLGARPEVVAGVRHWIAVRHSADVVCGAHHGYFDTAATPGVVEQIRASKADILLVALGAPRQDQWLAAHLAATGAKVGIGVGGLFDFYSGRIPRAPVWMRELGLEWVFRFYQEPRRMWRRYLIGNVQFVMRVLRERWGLAARALES